jgi:hypothetical protein
MVDTSYAFDDNAFPHLTKKQDNKTKSTTASTSYISISNQTLKIAIAAETDNLKAINKKHEATIDSRISSIKTTLASITKTSRQPLCRKQT